MARGRQKTRRRLFFARQWKPALLGVAILAAFAGARAFQGRDASVEGAPLAQGDPGVSHVHGLGVDPADGTLYAATHYGLFRIPEEGKATRVADRFQDTMGFTVVGPNRFLGSGHPDLRDKELRRDGVPPLLGLIESTNAGESWKPLSLFGEADFHALVAAHQRVYGFSATNRKFMVSEDGKLWDTRSEIGLASFAVDPADADHILGTAEEGVVSSTDGGGSWRPIQAPKLFFLSWDDEGDLWGAGPGGEVSRSGDGGSSWEPTGSLPGQPEALLADGSTLFAGVSGEGIFRSTDAGRTWQLRYRDP